MKSKHIVFIGNTGSGKTHCVNRLVTGRFNNCYKATVGVDLNIVEKEGDLFWLWDTEGQNPYDCIPADLFHQADMVVYLFDVSFHDLDQQIEKIRLDIERFNSTWHEKWQAKAPLILVANKKDLVAATKAKAVFESVCNHFAQEFSGYHLISLKTEEGMAELEKNVFQIAKEAEQNSINPLIDALTAVNRAFLKMPNKNKKQMQSLLNDFLSKPDIQQFTTKTLAEIASFREACTELLDGKQAMALKALKTFLSILLATFIAVTAGFLIGFAAGAWSGPAAFFTGLAGASVAAKAVLASTAVTGGLSGAVIGYGKFFKKPTSLVTFKSSLDDLSQVESKLRLAWKT